MEDKIEKTMDELFRALDEMVSLVDEKTVQRVIMAWNAYKAAIAEATA